MDLSERRNSSCTTTTTCQTALPEPALWQSHCKNQECPLNEAGGGEGQREAGQRVARTDKFRYI